MNAKKFPGAVSDGTGMRLAVTGAIDGKPKAPLLLRGDLAEVVKEAAAIGYKGIEIHVPDIWKWDAAAFAESCRAAGVAVSALVSGQLNVRQGLSLTHADAGVAAKAVEGLKLFADAAAIAGTGVVVGWVRGLVGEAVEENLAKQAAALREVGAYARDKGVPMYIEAINRYELDSLNTAAEIVRFIETNDIPNTYVHLDTYHMNIEEYSAEKGIRDAGSHLGYFHVAENTRWYPGHDRLDFDKVFEALGRAGYDGFVSVECLPFPTGPEAARRAYEFLAYRYFGAAR